MAKVQIIPNPNPRILWMGDLENYMNDAFLRNAFQQAFATTANLITHIKYPTSKFTGQLAGYCFIEFVDEQTAQKALQTLNGKIITGSMPQKRFRMNIAGERLTSSTPAVAEKNAKIVEYSVYVGDLDPSVEDSQLYDYFHKRFSSVTNANIIRDNEGKSKGFGFVRFSSEAEQLKVLAEYNGTMFYGRPIKVNTAQPRVRDQQITPRRGTAAYPPPNYYNAQLYQGYNNFTSYNQPSGYQTPYQAGYGPTGPAFPPTPNWGGPPASAMYAGYTASSQSASQYQSSDVEPPVLRDDPETANKDFVENRCEFWASIAQSRFLGATFPTSYLKDTPNDGVTPVLY